jgi:2-dehydropantoate 2-reductase
MHRGHWFGFRENHERRNDEISMKAIERIAIIGAGAVGASYASMFYSISKDSVAFIAAEARYSRLKQDGIVVNGKRYDIPVYLPGHIPEPYDLVMVAVKNHHLGSAVNDLHGAVGDETVMLSLMNGIESEVALSSAFGEEKILHSIVLGIDAVRVGNSTTYNNQGRLFFGEGRNLILTERVMLVKELLKRAGIHYVIPDDMIRTLWWKFMINVGINQASAALRAPYRLFQVPGEARALMDSAMREVMALAQHQGIDMNEKDIENWHDVLSNLSPDGKTSMLQDVEASRKTEVVMFAGKVIELGKRLGVATPVNEQLFLKIS